jgi:outer membrane protein TolC
MLSRRLALCTLLLLSTPLVGQAQQTVGSLGPVEGGAFADTVRMTVEEAIVYALGVSPEVGIAQARAERSDARLNLARASRFLTEFNAESAHSLAPGLDIPDDFTGDRDALYLDPRVKNDANDLRPFNQIEVEALQPLWTWGELTGSIDAARYGALADQAAVEVQATTTALRLVESYYALQLALRLEALAVETGPLIEQAKRQLSQLLEDGDPGVTDGDRRQVELTEQEFRRSLVEVQQGVLTARTALRRQLFLPETTTFAAADETLRPIAFERLPLDAYFSLARAYRAELQQAQAGLQARDALVTVAKSNYYPKLGVGAQARYAYTPGRYRQPNPYVNDALIGRSVVAGFAVRQNLNFGQTRARVEQAQAERAEVQFQTDAAQALVLFEVEEAYRSLVVAEAALEAQDEAFRITREWFLDESNALDLGIGDTENLVRAVRAKLEAEASYYERIQRYNVAVARLLDASGVLTLRAQTGALGASDASGTDLGQ